MVYIGIRFLIEEITMREDEPGNRQLKPLRTELASPQNQWDRVWPLARQYMLGPNICSFLFKLFHQILPTAERVARILPNQSATCSRCQVQTPETLYHAFFDCPANQGVSTVLLNGLKKYDPDLTPSKILTLDFSSEEEFQFSMIWITASFLCELFQLRVDKKRVELIKIRSELEASCRLLRESRLDNTIEMLSQIF